MSEFSESYHLRQASQEDAVQLLQRAGLKGIVFPSSSQWTSFVPGGQDWEALPAIVQANSGILLHYSYGEDHGWTIEVYEDAEHRMVFQHWWDDFSEELGDFAPSCPPNNPDIELLAQWIPQSPESFEVLQKCLMTDGQDRAYEFAQLIGLEYFKGLSPNSWSHSPESVRKPGVIEV
ncbi:MULTISPECIES: hypothetical protein [unclassified Leptolyngbya]|uniref:hypothetical protein n=1 Tax=unclassified Leptolyngbya TaxID=2650499 RepID=UPI001685BE78|nr:MULTISPECIES: hypothetical protein [unclassified Leptolyngbya]MBD1912956.1 hypothetical protein [Leptolyngbya sp. FACHB-8]MBD2157960.1 hypothetical protein [Leptolyngbya sp. FACHB-16]